MDRSLQHAQRRYDDASIYHRAQALKPLSEDFEKERLTLIGNFVDTLKDCDALLKENKHLRERHGNVVDNLRWHLSQQEQRVDDLLRRLHFHAEKIRLVIDRLSINLLSDLDAKVDDLTGLVERNLQLSEDILLELDSFRTTLFGYLAGHGSLDGPSTDDTHVPSIEVAQRFTQALAINAPPGIESGIPLVEGFDALFLSFEQSVESLDRDPENLKYLLLLKARWLLGHIKNSQGYYDARPGYYYKRAINQIEQGINARVRASAHVIAPSDATLLALPESSYLIWPTAPAHPTIRPSQPHPLSRRANEHEIVRIQLASEDHQQPDVVTVFQQSQEHFRIVLETRSLENEKIIIPQPIYIPEDSLIPRYALPSLDNPSLEIAIFSRRSSEEMLYKFALEEDLWKFQKALTGYEVSHDQSGILCQFSDNVAFLDCRGRIQLWQNPIVFQSSEQLGPPNGATLRSPSSSSAGLRSRQPSFTPSTSPTNTITWADGGWEAGSIKLPAITIFTQLADKRFAVIFIELVPGIEINPAECQCHKDYDTCSKLVLVRRDKPRFLVRFLTPPLDAQGSPNPNTFDILPFRLPRQSSYRHIPASQTKYVVLKFESLPAKKHFHRELNLRFNVRTAQIQGQIDFRNEMRVRQDRPRRNTQIGTPELTRRPSLHPSPSPINRVQTLPPHVEVPDNGPAFAESFAHGTDPIPCRAQTEESQNTSLSTSPTTNGSQNSSATPNTNTDGTDSDPAFHGGHQDLGQLGAIFPRIVPRRPADGANAIAPLPRLQTTTHTNSAARPNLLPQQRRSTLVNGHTTPTTEPRQTSPQDRFAPSPPNGRPHRQNTETTLRPESPAIRRRDSKGGRLKGFFRQM